MDLKGKVALVTGGSRGIGREIAIGFSKLGADIAITYNSNSTKAQELTEELIKNGVLKGT
jgi:NAD(P)-dependent dehydrogenase (short-subunit alcohol dehydrogenase family)